MGSSCDYIFVVSNESGRRVCEAAVAVADPREVASVAYLVATDARLGPSDRSAWTVEVVSPFGTPLGCLPFAYAERYGAAPVAEGAT